MAEDKSWENGGCASGGSDEELLRDIRGSQPPAGFVRDEDDDLVHEEVAGQDVVHRKHHVR